MKEIIAPKIFAEMSNPNIGIYFRVLFEIHIVKSPIMRKLSTYNYDISGLESLNAITDELGAVAFFKVNQLYFGVVMPAIIHMRNQILPDTKRMPWAF